MLVSGQMEPVLPNDTEMVSILELVSDLRAECAGLMPHIGVESRIALARILRAMNSYYTNKIEGQHTYPAELENALESNFSSNGDIKKRQQLAIAHMQVEEEFEAIAPGVSWDAMFEQKWISSIHTSLYSKLDDESLIILDEGGKQCGQMAPGAIRSTNVKVGAHWAPEFADVPALMEHFYFRYGQPHYRDATKIVVAGASMHRLSWIHPFPDGNGRVSRLHNHILLSHLGLTGGLWSPMRGLARRQQEYYGALHQADLPRRNDTDGRGALSSKGLADFVTFWVEVCLDQVRFMAQLLSLQTMETRYVSLALQFLHDYGKGPILHHRSKLSPDLLGRALHQLFKTGRLDRGAFKAMLDTSDRTASRVISKLQEQRLIFSPSKSAPLEPRFPFASFRFLFPGLWPEAEGVINRPVSKKEDSRQE